MSAPLPPAGAELQSRTCWVYKSRRHPETYLFVTGEDDFGDVPAPLLERMGTLELALCFELRAGRTLASANAAAVLEALATRGFYLQLPPGKE